MIQMDSRAHCQRPKNPLVDGWEKRLGCPLSEDGSSPDGGPVWPELQAPLLAPYWIACKIQAERCASCGASAEFPSGHLHRKDGALVGIYFLPLGGCRGCIWGQKCTFHVRWPRPVGE